MRLGETPAACTCQVCSQPALIQCISNTQRLDLPAFCFIIPGLKAKDIINQSRENVARMVGGKATDIIFTSGGTEVKTFSNLTGLCGTSKFFLKNSKCDCFFKYYLVLCIKYCRYKVCKLNSLQLHTFYDTIYCTSTVKKVLHCCGLKIRKKLLLQEWD